MRYGIMVLGLCGVMVVGFPLLVVPNQRPLLEEERKTSARAEYFSV
jgi:hypothetical protein